MHVHVYVCYCYDYNVSRQWCCSAFAQRGYSSFVSILWSLLYELACNVCNSAIELLVNVHMWSGILSQIKVCPHKL